MRPHHAPGGGNVARTLDDILKEIKRAEAAAAGTYAGNPAAQAAAAQAQGYDPLRAYLYRQQQDAAAETSRALARMGQAQLGRQFWASAAGQAQAAAGAREQGAVGAESTQRRLTEARARLDYVKTPEGRQAVREQQEGEKELRRLNKEAANAADRLRPFGERLTEGARSAAQAAGGALALAGGVVAATERLVAIADPSTAATFRNSLELLSAKIGTTLAPALLHLAKSAQYAADWWDKTVNAPANQPAEGQSFLDRLKGIPGRSIGRFAEMFAENPLLSTVTAGGRPAANTASLALLDLFNPGSSRSVDAERRRRGADVGMSFEAPGGGPIARYMTGEQYGEALNVAGLEVGPNDPKTQILNEQLKNLQAHGGLLQDIAKNQEATNRYLQSLQAWR